MKWALDVQARAKSGQRLPVVIGIPTMTFGEYDCGPTTGRLIVEIANRTLPGYVKKTGMSFMPEMPGVAWCVCASKAGPASATC